MTANNPHEQPPARAHLSLKWKAFGALLVLLGGAQLTVSQFGLRAELRQHERSTEVRMERLTEVLREVLADAGAQRALLASQVAAAVDSRSLPATPPHAALPIEAGETLAWVSFFTADGRLLGTWLEQPEALPAGARTALQREVRQEHRPASRIVCARRCVHLHEIPAFDRSGREVIVELAGDLSAPLQRFYRFGGGDVVLFGGAQGIGTLWGRTMAMVSNASAVVPLFAGTDAGGLLQEEGRIGQLEQNGRHYRLMLTRLTEAWEPAASPALVVLDVTADVVNIQTSALRNTLFTFAGFALSAVLLYALIGFAMRRLSKISDALPLLAEERYGEARLALADRPGARLLFDEVDQLRDTVLAANNRLERLRGAEAASEAKSLFLAAMSHEIRTPLNGMLGMLELLERDELNEQQRTSLGVVRESGLALLRVIDDILDFSKIEAGRLDIERLPFELAEVVEGVMQILDSKAGNRGVRLVAFVDPAIPRSLAGDRLRVRQVLLNLCGNATKFTERGRILLRADRGHAAGPGVRVKFRVIDTGIGIPENKQASLFQPFTQAESSTSRRFGGTGLGLSICRGLVERMGGTIGLISREGVGSEFWFELDFGLPTQPAEDPDRHLLCGVRVKISLAAADEGEMLRRYLEAAGARVDDAAAAPGPGEIQLLIHGRGGADDTQRKDSSFVVRRAESSPAAGVTVAHPVRRHTFVHLVAAIAWPETVRKTDRAPAAPAAPARSGVRILVAEDHPTNQYVIRRQLEALGYTAEVVEDGLQALQLLNRPGHETDYALLLADMHMPQLDGLDMTREIRRLEASGERAGHLPIIALTASAVRGEAERCHAAGMDDYLTKPVNLDDLRDRISHWLPPTPARAPDGPAPAAQATPVPSVPSAPAPVDLAALRNLIGADEDVLDEVLNDFVRINTPLFRQMDDAWRREDLKEVKALAHKLLGSARTACTKTLADALTALEKAAHDGRRSELEALVQRSALAFQQVCDWLAASRR